ncbi:unnamed protein product [Lepeophtheirus salmonis]|uniref:(salmon louse) hypothetical protein n=1 Tax=Lepeophtheirus salmonis TaxID=72036 RepID=A0A817FD71_LEPSM|nr:unnamed protein product [Lepeophtheirus salmonis]
MPARKHIFSNDPSEEVRVIFDPGSQISLVTSGVVKHHKFLTILVEMSIHGVADSYESFRHGIRLQTRTGTSVLMEAFEVNRILNTTYQLRKLYYLFHIYEI